MRNVFYKRQSSSLEKNDWDEKMPKDDHWDEMSEDDRLKIIRSGFLSDKFIENVIDLNNASSEVINAIQYGQSALEVLKSIERDIVKFSRILFPDANIPENLELESYFDFAKKCEPLGDFIEESFKRNEAIEGKFSHFFPNFIRDDLRDEINRKKQTKEKEQKRENSKFPLIVRQHTFQEVRNLGQAITDGATLQNWKEIPGEVALGHTIEGQPIETKLTAGKDIDWFGAPVTYDSLREELRKLTPEGVLLFQFALESVLLHQHATLSLDDLIREIGWTPKNREDRNQMRWQIYYWLCVFTNFTSHGTRPGIYKNPTTREKGKIVTSSSYFAITDKERLQDSDIPLRVTITASKWIADYKNDNAVLQHFGNLRKLAGLPTGQPRGEYALCIGLAAFQKWREDATRCETKRIGEQNVETVIYKPLARFDLLNMFRPGKFPIKDILKSDRPKRAQVYWNEAVTELKKRGVIGYYKAPDDKTLPRQGWQDNWLYGKNIEMRPFGDERQAAVELSKSASSKRKRFKNTGPKTKTP
jgi:hypothetical protein